MKIFSAPNRSQSSPVFGVMPWSGERLEGVQRKERVHPDRELTAIRETLEDLRVRETALQEDRRDRLLGHRREPGDVVDRRDADRVELCHHALGAHQLLLQ